ncbi:hypothetical protein BUB20358_06797 [Burkholderia ubonensis]|nr:hypothetical protein BUB20358_06797 [Burkholderia ubonensis]
MRCCGSIYSASRSPMPKKRLSKPCTSAIWPPSLATILPSSAEPGAWKRATSQRVPSNGRTMSAPASNWSQNVSTSFAPAGIRQAMPITAMSPRAAAARDAAGSAAAGAVASSGCGCGACGACGACAASRARRSSSSRRDTAATLGQSNISETGSDSCNCAAKRLRSSTDSSESMPSSVSERAGSIASPASIASTSRTVASTCASICLRAAASVCCSSSRTKPASRSPAGPAGFAAGRAAAPETRSNSGCAVRSAR